MLTMIDFKLGQMRAAGMATLVTVLALTGAVQVQAAQPKPQYPTRKPAAEAGDAKPAKQVTPPVSSTTPESAEPNQGGWTEIRKKSVDIGTQPVRDVGVMKRQIPPILVKAQNDPYSLKGLKSCKQLSGELTELNQVLGADYVVGNEVKENRAGKLAEAGGKTVINSIIPFRSLVREVTGAAPADRRLNAALDAGYARRGFLRGVHARQGCKTTF
jgi:hypothetical protein